MSLGEIKQMNHDKHHEYCCIHEKTVNFTNVQLFKKKRIINNFQYMGNVIYSKTMFKFN